MLSHSFLTLFVGFIVIEMFYVYLYNTLEVRIFNNMEKLKSEK